LLRRKPQAAEQRVEGDALEGDVEPARRGLGVARGGVAKPRRSASVGC
jgi:hypothetical protein